MSAQAADPMEKWEQFDFTANPITADQLKDLSPLQLKYMRGIVFGKHGRVFDEAAIQNWLQSRKWYKPDKAYRVTVLNANERADMDAIKEAEWRKHDFIEPGDLKFYRNKIILREALGTHSNIEWRIMRAEIEAIHGKTFPDQPWLQSFFAERYWYHPDANYRQALLNDSERNNLDMIAQAEKEERKVALAPGDMALFEETPISTDLLKGLSLFELRQLRNEVYARHGKRFRTDWIQAYFHDQPWYKPLPDFRDPKLSALETQNVAAIVAAERRIHDSLTTNPIDSSLMVNLSPEDIRKLRLEIYARHGKIFTDKWLNGYFRSMAWYKPDPDFHEAALGSIEKHNVAVILAFEKKATHEAMTSAA